MLRSVKKLKYKKIRVCSQNANFLELSQKPAQVAGKQIRKPAMSTYTHTHTHKRWIFWYAHRIWNSSLGNMDFRYRTEDDIFECNPHWSWTWVWSLLAISYYTSLLHMYMYPMQSWPLMHWQCGKESAKDCFERQTRMWHGCIIYRVECIHTWW